MVPSALLKTSYLKVVTAAVVVLSLMVLEALQ